MYTKIQKLFITAVFIFANCMFARAQGLTADFNILLRTGKGTLVLNSGETFTGTFNFYLIHDYLKFLKEFGDKEEKYAIKDVKSFSINDSVFYSKLTKGAEITMSKKKTFVLLKNSVNSKIKLYERTYLLDQYAESLETRIKQDLYLELPEDSEEVYSTTALKFIPFAKKISTLLAECPALALKIKEKEEGYAVAVLPKMSMNLMKMANSAVAGRPDNVWMKIMLEYDECSKK
ncbi:MAG: hypothetical protein JWQ25_2428 [Daejeonella sp.]|nr:hypothetical protein [Daejeonella sp.]